MRKNRNRRFIIVSVSLCLCLYLASTISAMQIGGFDIDVGNGGSSSWKWQEEQQQQWNQSNWESSWESNWENTWQNGEDAAEIPSQGNQGQDSGYQYNIDTGNGTQDNTQWWDNNMQQNYADGNNSSQWADNSLWNNEQSNYDTRNNNNIQSNHGIQDNNSQINSNSSWDARYQMGDYSGQTASQTGNEDVDEISGGITIEEISPTLGSIPTLTVTPTSRPVQTPKPTKPPKATKTPKPTRTPAPEPMKKKNEKKQNGRNETGKENKNADNSENLKNGDDQGNSVKYICAKDESVEFKCTQNPDNSHIPQVQIISKGSVQVLSFRLNGTECPWHWEGDWIVPEVAIDGDTNKIELLVVSQGGKLIKMEPWSFSS